MSSILEKLEVRSRTEAAAAAFGLGILADGRLVALTRPNGGLAGIWEIHAILEQSGREVGADPKAGTAEARVRALKVG